MMSPATCHLGKRGRKKSLFPKLLLSLPYPPITGESGAAIAFTHNSVKYSISSVPPTQIHFRWVYTPLGGVGDPFPIIPNPRTPPFHLPATTYHPQNI